MSTFPFGQSKEVVLHVRVEPLLYLDASEITPENLVVSLVQAAIDQLRHHLEEEPERLPEFLTRTTILDTYDQQEEPEPPECPKCGSVKVMWSGGSSWECCDCGKAISYDIT